MWFNPRRQSGFSLVEIAVVLVIVALIIGSLLGPLTAQRETQKIKTTEALLEDIHDTLLGYAAINGFLPCPASAASSGVEVRTGGPGSDCAQEHGFIPSATLGIRGSFNAQQQLVDAWSWPVRYSLNDVNSWEYAKAIDVNSLSPTYNICDSAGCGGNTLAANVLAVIYSLGKDGDTSPASADQLDNLDNDDDFVVRPFSEQFGGEYDDIVTWVAPASVILALVKAGRLN